MRCARRVFAWSGSSGAPSRLRWIPDPNGTVIGPHAYAHFPAGEVMGHEAAGDEPCLLVILFHGPFDVVVAGN